MNFIECHCAHSLYGNHSCGGSLTLLVLEPGLQIWVCDECKHHIISFDLALHK